MIAFLLAACVGQAVDVPKEIKGAPGAWVIVAPKVDGGAPKWRIDPALQEVELGQLLPPEFTSKLKGRVFTSNVPGRYKIELWCAKANVASDIATTWIVIGNPPPVPPGPGPDPKPKPDPDPSPKDAPIAGDGLRVLIVHETSQPLSQSQFATIYGQQFRDYLRAKCAKGADGSAEARIWDKDVDTKDAPKHWQDAMKRPRQSIPWLIVSNGKTGFEGPLPQTLDEALAIVKRFEQ